MEWQFDIRTALQVCAALSLLCGGVMLAISGSLSPGLKPGLRQWMLAIVLHPAGMVLLSLREAISPWVSIVAANAAIAVAFVLYGQSLRRLAGESGRSPVAWSLAVAAIAISTVFGIVLPDLHWRLVLVSLPLGALLLQAAADMRRLYGRDSAAATVVWISLGFGGLILLYRAIAMAVDPGLVTTVFEINHVQVLTYAVGSLLPVIATIGVLLLCTELMQAELLRVSRLDHLTGAYNRRAIEDLGERAMAWARRHGSGLSALVVDADHFKHINDAHGHAAGDHALQAVVACIRAQLRSEDLLGRLGGEEFLVLLPGTQLAEALPAAERIRRAVAATPLPIDKAALHLTVSIGATELAPGDLQFSHLLQRADRAMYAAKHAGRDRVLSEPGPRPD